MSDQKYNVLIVDDEEDIRVLLATILEQEGYLCSFASSGKEALGILESDSVDVVITDVEMPNMNGIQLTSKIKKKYNIPVLVMTGYANEYSAAEAIQSGAADFVTKPFNVAKMCGILKKLTEG